MFGRLVGWLVGCTFGKLGWFVSWLVGWLVGCTSAYRESPGNV